VDKWVVDPGTGAGELVPMTPEEEAQAVADQAASRDRELGQTQARAGDAERLAVIAERAATDPAFAALADLTLGKQGV
jgi:hypothetical protein